MENPFLAPPVLFLSFLYLSLPSILLFVLVSKKRLEFKKTHLLATFLVGLLFVASTFLSVAILMVAGWMALGNILGDIETPSLSLMVYVPLLVLAANFLVLPTVTVLIIKKRRPTRLFWRFCLVLSVLNLLFVGVGLLFLKPFLGF